MIATKNVLREVERIITLLDYKRKGSGRIHVYRLRNADADEIAQTLSSLATGSPGGGGAARRRARLAHRHDAHLAHGPGLEHEPRGHGAGRARRQRAALAASAVAELGDGVRVTADAPTNSLIIQASAEAYATLAEVIEALDTRRPQVMVEALIMEVNATPTNDLGAAWITTMATKDGSTLGHRQRQPGRRRLDRRGSTGLATGGASAVGFVTAFLGRTVSIPDPNNPGQFIQVPWIRALITASRRDHEHEHHLGADDPHRRQEGSRDRRRPEHPRADLAAAGGGNDDRSRTTRSRPRRTSRARTSA